MPITQIQHYKNKAKLLQKAKIKAGKPFLLKQAFDLIAKTAGFSSWRDMKAALQQQDYLFPAGASAFWKVWYRSYNEARAHLDKQPDHFLIGYQKQFCICDVHYIEKLGVDLDDPDLLIAGHDWVYPADADALQRVIEKIKTRL